MGIEITELTHVCATKNIYATQAIRSENGANRDWYVGHWSASVTSGMRILFCPFCGEHLKESKWISQ